MANRFPLIIDSSALQIKEIPANDNLDLANNNIVNVVDINASGVVTATSFSGSGVGLTNLPSAQLTGALPAIDGSALTGVISGIGIKTEGGNVGFGVTILDFRGSGVSTITAPVSGVSTIHIIDISGNIIGIDTLGTSYFNNLNVSGVSTFIKTISLYPNLDTGISPALISGATEYEAGVIRLYSGGSAGNDYFEIDPNNTDIDIKHIGPSAGNIKISVTENIGINSLSPKSKVDIVGNVRVSGVSTLSSNVSVGGTISVDGGVTLATNNATIVGTSGTTGEIKQIGGAPFYYDGSAWREFVLSSGTPVTEPADTEWDNVIFRATFDDDYTDAKFGATPVAVGGGTTIVNSPLKIGTSCFRNSGISSGGIAYPYRSEYDFDGPWTIEFWMYLDDVPTSGSYVSLVSMVGDENADENWALGLSRDYYGVYTIVWMNNNISGTKTLYSSASNSILQNWVHLALVREQEDGSFHFYVNGQETTQTAVTGVFDNDILNNANARLGIGGTAAAGSFDAYFTVNTNQTVDAHFDDVRITKSARYTSVGIATTVFTPPTTALPTSGTLSSVINPPGDKYGEIGLGTSPTWRGTSGVTVSQQSSGNYRVSFASTYTNANDYYVLSQGMDQGFASYVGIARSTSHVDLSINRQSNDAAVDTGSLGVQIKNHI